MWVEQAVYTSTRTRHGSGYHVVAKSRGISGKVITALNQWSPSHASLQSNESTAESFNFHPLTDDLLAVSRTTYGGKEYSDRGGLQVATMTIVIHRNQLAGYDYNPFRLIRVARSLGWLRWQPRFTERLDSIELPDREVAETLTNAEIGDVHPEPIQAQIQNGDPIVVVCSEHQVHLTESIVKSLPDTRRPTFSFTTGLKWSEQRPFAFQVVTEIDTKTRLRLQVAHVTVIDSPSDIGLLKTRPNASVLVGSS